MESTKKIKVIDREYEVPEILIRRIDTVVNQDEELKTMFSTTENGIEITAKNRETLKKALMILADILAGCLVSHISFYDDELFPPDSDFDKDYILNIGRKVNSYSELIDLYLSKNEDEKAISALLRYIEYSIGTYIEIHNKEQSKEEQNQI